MTRTAIITATLLGLVPVAQAQTRSVEYFIAHPAERQQTTHRCASTQLTDECLAAFKAGDVLQSRAAERRVNAGRQGIGSNESPAYFDQFPLARMMTLNECAHPTGAAYGPTPQTCQAARISAGQ